MNNEQLVRQVYPDAEEHANDYYHHWIGRKTLSEGFEEDHVALSAAFELPGEEVHAAIKAVQQAAIDKAWEDAAAKLPKLSAPAVGQLNGITDEEIESKWAELNADDGDIRVMAMLHELLQRRKSVRD